MPCCLLCLCVGWPYLLRQGFPSLYQSLQQGEQHSSSITKSHETSSQKQQSLRSHTTDIKQRGCWNMPRHLHTQASGLLFFKRNSRQEVNVSGYCFGTVHIFKCSPLLTKSSLLEFLSMPMCFEMIWNAVVEFWLRLYGAVQIWVNRACPMLLHYLLLPSYCFFPFCECK